MSYLLMTTLALCLSGAPSGDDEAKSKAAALLDEGNNLFDAKRFELALEKFEAAYASYASPKILLNLAEAQRELGRLDLAAAAYEQFLDETKQKGDPKFRETAEARLLALTESVGRVDLLGLLAGDRVELDAEPLAPRDGHVFVMPGRHQLNVHRSGAGTFIQEVTPGAGQRIEADVTFETQKPGAIALSPPPPPAAASGGDETPSIDAKPENRRLLAQEPDAKLEGERPITSEWWFWTGVGAVVVTTVVVIAIAASSGGDDFVPEGELGKVSTSSWQPFMVGGLR